MQVSLGIAGNPLFTGFIVQPHSLLDSPSDDDDDDKAGFFGTFVGFLGRFVHIVL